MTANDKKPRNAGGRPKITWGDEQIATFKGLCNVFCTEEEVCSILGVSDKTLVRLINEYLYEDVTGEKKKRGSKPISFKDAFDKYSCQGKASIRRQQFKLAQAGDRTMLIWLGKQWLGQTDRVEQNVVELPVIVDDIE